MSGSHRAARASATGALDQSSHDLSVNQQLVATTGRSFDEWFDVLDNAGAEQWPQWKIKRYLAGQRKNDEWWASAVALAYETARGFHPAHSTYSVRVSKTIHADATDIWNLIDDEDERRTWLDVEVEERSRKAQSALYCELADGSMVTISLRNNPRSTHSAGASILVTIYHSGLEHESCLEETKAFWRSALTALSGTVSENLSEVLP